MRKPPADPPFGPVPFAGLRLPFVDRFGQFVHADWPEKVRDPSELAADLRAERAALRPPPASWDRFGGWRDGPALEATGAFRVERLDGRWRLVDPDGRLFFSYGLDTLRHYTDAPNGHRHPAWYETEPPPNGRMAFTHWNLQRKFGKIDYLADYYDFILRRLDDWGFNTIGRWSARRLPLLERRPYLLLLDSPARAPRIPGTRHYDPYHPDFARRFAEGVAAQTRDPDVARAADDPFCIGLSIDNEPPFGGMIGAMLAQDASGCPAKNAFLAAVRARHPDLGALNAAWGTAFPTWPAVAALAAPVPGPGFAADASAFLLDWLRRTFSAARAAVKALAPRRLYFACAFGGADAPPVAWDAAAEHADALLADVHLRGVESWRPLGTGAARVGTADSVDQSLVCECEEVSVGEINSAIERLDVNGLTDLRRRTRMGMGTCQGELCGCRAAGLLAKAHGCTDRARTDLQEFMTERWKGMYPIGWGDALREAEYTQWVYKHVLGV